ncbi:MAG: branched-chain amino acid ABC transporter permease, partial [candidate division WOR-3 bacterium]
MKGRNKPGAGWVALLVAVAGFAVLQGLMLGRVINPYLQAIASYAGIMAVSALGLNLIYGYTGQFSLGHAAFYGIGAYVSALVTRSLGCGFWVLPVGIVAGTLVAGVIALGIGLPILRLKSDYLGIATLGFGMIMNVLFKNSDKLIPVMGGSCGMRGIGRLTSLAWVFLVVLMAIAALRNIVFSGVGRALMSIREDELASEAVGINATRFKTLGFVVGCMYAGVAGAIYALL